MAQADEMNRYPLYPSGRPQRMPEDAAYSPQYDDSYPVALDDLALGLGQGPAYRDYGPYALANQHIMEVGHSKKAPDSPMTAPWAGHAMNRERDRDDTHYTSSSAATTPFPSYVRTSGSTCTAPSTIDESPIPSQLPSPCCDSRGDRSNSAEYGQSATSAPRQQHPSEASRRSSSLTSETRDAFHPLRSPINSIFDARYPTTEPTSPRSVGNFSRPRNASNTRMNPDIRAHPSNLMRSEPSRSDISPNHTPSTASWPRERGQSVSSNQSSATFASLPIRPSEMHHGDSFRSRARQPNTPTSRPPISHNRMDGSNGPFWSPDPIPRMASLPSDELRSRYRPQQPESTAQGTTETGRSSIMTKMSSRASMYRQSTFRISMYGGPVDEEFSVDDVIGLYENEYEDDSGREDNRDDNDSRPPTAGSELRRRTLVLNAMTGAPPMRTTPAKVPDSGTIVRDSAAIRASGAPSFPADKLPEEPRETPPDDSLERPPEEPREETEVRGSVDLEAKHDSGMVVVEDGLRDDEDADFRPRMPQRQQTDMTLTLDADRDRYGFRKQNQYITRDQYNAWNDGYTEYLARRKKKWCAYLKENGLMTDSPNRFPPRSAKTKRFIRKGIPPEWRGAAWFYYAGGPAILAKHAGLYDELLKRDAKDVDLEAIERDLHRTFPDNFKFRSHSVSAATELAGSRNSQYTAKSAPPSDGTKRRETPMISSLRRVLHAFAIYNPRIGYCQSLNFLAGLLLLFVETEEHAFWLLNIITRVYLPGTHEVSLEGANVDLGVLMSELRESMPAVWAKIGGELDGTDTASIRTNRIRRNRNKQLEPTRLPPITLCMTAWFMSCFIGTLPIESTLRVWDVFFYEGSKTLFRVAMAIFKLGEAEIKAVGDLMEIFQVVQTIPRRFIDANALMDACFKRRNGFGHINQEMIDQKRLERRFLVKAEKEKMTLGDDAVIPDFNLKRRGPLWSRRKDHTFPAEMM
ncbi:hypothetical protein DL764_006427 [Monosporascus ibericus]|uniref:Rab-GAP TBC domain-containing protein n=1 Tax=Monosporascus ibericus TaxID=155417 RepID=A0A4Q4T4S2_9PEZI|nr:hypothetical protein DL764_006427 [Monosporascus ibericus]